MNTRLTSPPSYRHQLNHTPKQIYECDYPGCTRSFVRLDLCNRHRDRHTAKGSALNRRDSMIGHVSPITDGRPPFATPGSVSPEANRPGTGYTDKLGPTHLPFHSPKGLGGPYTPGGGTPPTSYANGGHANGIDHLHHDGAYGAGHGPRSAYHSPQGPQRPSVQTGMGQYGVMSPVSAQHGYHSQASGTPQSGVYAPASNFTPFSLPPSDFAQTSSAAVPREAAPSYVPATSGEYGEQGSTQVASEMMMLDQMAMPNTMPMFGSDSILQKSPYVGMPEDFMAYLFNTQQGEGASPMVVAQEPFPK